MESGLQRRFQDSNVDGLLASGPGIWRPTKRQATENQYLSDDYAMRIDDIASKLGISRQRTYQLLNSALKNCAKWAREHGYRLEDLLPDPRAEPDRRDSSA
jgi:hypothetical protein